MMKPATLIAAGIAFANVVSTSVRADPPPLTGPPRLLHVIPSWDVSEPIIFPADRLPAQSTWGPEYLGLRIGMDFDAAEAVVRRHFHVTRLLEPPHAVKYGERWISSQDGPFRAKLFLNDDYTEAIALFRAPGNASRRLVFAAHAQLSKSSAREWVHEVSERLGEPIAMTPSLDAVSTTRDLAWGDGGFACAMIGGNGASLYWPVTEGSPLPQVIPGTLSTITHSLSPPAMGFVTQDACTGAIAAHLNEGSWNGFRLLATVQLMDLGLLRWLTPLPNAPE